MSYAIIRNAKYKLANLQSISRHNERQNQEYGNNDIDTSRTLENYHLHKPQERSYEREFFRLREENDLKGNLRLTGKKQSNIACEFIITSGNDFFKNIFEHERERFFQSAYDFAAGKCGKENIISAVVHMDESTPHMHLMYIPVVEATSKKYGDIKKINCSEFWKGFNSYGKLQDDFHSFMKERGFNLDRGERNTGRQHLTLEEYKLKTAQSKTIDLISEGQHLQERITALQREISTLEGQFIGRELAANELQRIKPGKSMMGAVKNITVEDVENLKKTAAQYHAVKYELDKALGDFERIKKRVPSLEDHSEQIRDKMRLEQLERAFDQLPADLKEKLMPGRTLDIHHER